MRRSHLTCILTVVLLFAFLPGAMAQDLLRSNPNYLKARELQLKAEQALRDGEYDKSYEYAEESKRLSALAEAEAEALFQRYRATNWKSLATRRIEYAKAVRAEQSFPDEFQRATASFEAGLKAYEAEEWATSTESFRAVLKALENVRPTK